MLGDFILHLGGIQNMVFKKAAFFLLIAANYLPSECDKSKNPNKIVIAGGSLTEIVYDLKEEEKILAVDVTSNFPPEVKDFPSVGYVRALSTEGLLSLGPTLILGEEDMGPPLVLDQLKIVGVDIRVIKDDFSSSSILSKVECISEIIGAKKINTKRLINNLKEKINVLETNIKKNNRAMTILLILGLQGTSPIAAGHSTSGHGFINLLGAKNIMEDVEGWKPISSESILLKNPDIILVTKRGIRSFKNDEAFSKHSSIKFTNAAKNRNVFSLDGMSMLGFGPRTIETAIFVSENLIN